ncbi:Nanos-like 1 [Holothuria leucospilota]|uniref:Nanos-like 1 n=1 Tax=Holothuria leucospilota TaxID=206669 RepID=A0A9Q1H738_HOLLE|nr:Nanos-like 1 [Holothuria leucospilota]
MAEFCPLKDYFGLNALVSKIVNEDEFQPSKSSSVAPTGRPEISRSSPTYVDHTSPHTSPPSQRNEGTNKLEDFDIIRMSRVYKERLTNVRRRRRPITHCVFCRNNAESEEVYTSHTLKDSHQNITCPILRAYTCPICGASGDGAHTIKYCPYKAQQSHMSNTSFT